MADDRGDEIATFDVSVLVRYADLAVEGLGAAREEIDALNVYPVPDGDTGTNMYLTVESARDQMAEGGPHDRTAAVFAQGLRARPAAAYAAVCAQVAGTRPSVAAAAAEGAEK